MTSLNQIVQTRLRPPQQRASMIDRPQLLGALEGALTSHKLTLLSAPAGYGKTSLVAAALRSSGLPGAWLSLDEEDNDPALFVTALVLALQQLYPGCGTGALALVPELAAPGGSLRRLIGALINELLEAITTPCVLVLDDLHLIGEPSIYAGLDYLLERLPPLLHLAVATRHDPPLSLARLRAAGELAELRIADLGFSADEVDELLNERLGLGLGVPQLAAIRRYTEGWPAGLRLVATSLARASGPPERSTLLSTFARSNHLIFEFLADEVLRRQEPTLRVFLLETSILHELRPELCAAVTGAPDAAATLAELIQRGLFITDLDEPSGTLRYHALFAEFLRSRLANEQPQRLAELHRRAAAAHPQPERAIAHALSAQDWVDAAQRIEALGETLVAQGLLQTLRGWLAQLPPTLLEQRPGLAYLQSFCAWQQAGVAEAARWMEQAQAGYAALGEHEHEGEALAMLATLAFIQGEPLRAFVLTEQAMAYQTRPAARIQLLLSRARLALLQRDWGQGHASLEEALALCASAREPGLLGTLLTRAGPMLLATREGLDWSERAEALAHAVLGARPGPHHLGLYMLIARRSIARGLLDEAQQAGEQALELMRRFELHNPPMMLTTLATLAGVKQARRDEPAAASYLDQIERTLEGAAADDVLAFGALATIGRARIHQGRGAEARAIYERMLGARRLAALPNFQPALLVIRGLLEQSAGDLPAAEQTLREATRLEQEYQLTLSFGSARLLLALFYQRRGKLAATLEELDALLEQCERDDRPGLILREGALALPLLRLALQHSLRAPFVTRLLALLGEPVAGQTVRVEATGELLSARELEVLRLLATGASNRQIATQLVIGEPTVKTHLAKLFRKLDVATRAEAVARAHELLII